MQRVEHHSPDERDEIERRQRRELEKYKVLIYLASVFLVAMGFGFKTPAQNYKELSDRIDVLARQVQKDSVAKAEIKDQLNVLITFQCMGQNPRDMAIARVDCSRYIPLLHPPVGDKQ
jgi:hypothetical protein